MEGTSKDGSRVLLIDGKRGVWMLYKRTKDAGDGPGVFVEEVVQSWNRRKCQAVHVVVVPLDLRSPGRALEQLRKDDFYRVHTLPTSLGERLTRTTGPSRGRSTGTPGVNPRREKERDVQRHSYSQRHVHTRREETCRQTGKVPQRE